MESDDQFTLNDIAANFKAKLKLITFLSRDDNIYLPAKKDITQNS